MTLDSISPASGERLGSVAVTPPAELPAVVARAADPQRMWALVPPFARARYLRRIAMAILDEVDELADLLAAEAGRPRTEALLAELLPTVAGLHALADDGPDALEDRRLGRVPWLRAGRRSTLLQSPAGVVGVRADPASPLAEPALDLAAALLAGDGVVLAPAAPLTAERLRATFERAGIPEGLVQVVHGEQAAAALEDVCDRVDNAGGPAPRKGTMLVLGGAPLHRTVPGALWAAFSYAGQGRAAVGRMVAVPAVAEPLLAGIHSAARALHVGDPRHPETEVGPLRSPEQAEAVERLIDEAVAAGATVLCGGRTSVPGLSGTFFAPAVLRGVPPDARILRERVPGPVLAVVEARSEREAIALAGDGAETVSVWTGDRAQGERVARSLRAELAWVNDHGLSQPAAPVRIARHVAVRQLASQPTRLRSARWLPYDAALVRASVASARVMHGRESERWSALRGGAIPLARTALRLAREAVSR